MFYVFYVNEGSLHALEIAVALGPVHKLQNVIEEVTRVPVAEQALLVSGGEGMQPEKQVSHYQGVGTESNPVFLFRKLYKDDNKCTVPLNSEFSTLCANLYDELHILDSSSISRTLITRYCDASRSVLKIAEAGLQLCARLVQDHQLLHQGWLALMSNLCESRAQIDKKAERFFSRYERLKTMRLKAESVVQDFDNVLLTLHQIKIPSSLLSNSYKLQGVTMDADDCTLYEYIARADPRNSLEEMSEQVAVLLEKTNDTEYKHVTANMRYVTEHVNNAEMRNIRGINTRLTQLDSMFHNKQQQSKVLRDLCVAVSQPVLDPQSFKDVVLNQREKMTEARKLIEQMQKLGKAFLQSKIELLNNIRTRLRGWILQVYDKLHTTNNQIILFEEKYIALRNRLDIIRQVKETPIMYATALTECLRRSVLQPEFESWFTSFMEKSSALVTEETSVREVFKQKLGRHFLKQLFPGMFDSFPNFAPSGLAQFDKNLPPVTAADLRALRQSVPYLANLLKVTDPFIYQRLSIKDPRVAPGAQMPVLKREESFYTTDTTINVANLNKNFPSTHWLSGDENLDVSPSNATMLAKSPPSRFGSSQSLDMVEECPAKPLNPLVSFFDTSHDERVEVEAEVGTEKPYIGSNVPKSAPIAIPQCSASSARQMIAPLVEENSVKQISDRSSQFGTPDDHLSYHPTIDDMNERPQAGNTAGLQDGLKKLSTELMFLKQELVATEGQVRECSQGILTQMENSITAFIVQMERIISSMQPVKPHCKDAFTEADLNEKLEESFTMGDVEEVHEKDMLIADLQKAIERQKTELAQLREEKLNAERTIAKLEAERNEMYKTLVIDHELALEREASSHSEEIKRKDKEIESLKAAFHKLRESGVHHDIENVEGATSADEIRAGYEKEYKSKMQLLMAGVEEKKAEEIARIKKEAEFDYRLLLRKYEERITELEKSVTGSTPVDIKKRHSIAPESLILEEGAASSLPNYLVRESLLKSFTTSHVRVNMADFMDLKNDDDKKDSGKSESTDGDSRAQVDSDEDISPVTARPAATQTTISLREIRTMITVQDIREYCAVLIVWSEPHNAYILFSVSPVFHFVKESSLRRLGVKWDRQSTAAGPSTVQRPNWLMATTTRLELCKIRKADNRYNLKIGTKFYRVEVEPLQIDSSSIRRHVDE